MKVRELVAGLKRYGTDCEPVRVRFIEDGVVAEVVDYKEEGSIFVLIVEAV